MNACTIKTRQGAIDVIVWPDDTVSIRALNAKGHTCKRLGFIRLSPGALYGIVNHLHESGWVKRTTALAGKETP